LGPTVAGGIALIAERSTPQYCDSGPSEKIAPAPSLVTSLQNSQFFIRASQAVKDHAIIASDIAKNNFFFIRKAF
jgi:hypothetical protein